MCKAVQSQRGRPPPREGAPRQDARSTHAPDSNRRTARLPWISTAAKAALWTHLRDALSHEECVEKLEAGQKKLRTLVEENEKRPSLPSGKPFANVIDCASNLTKYARHRPGLPGRATQRGQGKTREGQNASSPHSVKRVRRPRSFFTTMRRAGAIGCGLVTAWALSPRTRRPL